MDEELEEHFADILYTCDYAGKGKVRIALLLEHKSYKEDYPHWQLNQYILNVWKSGFKQKKVKPIPIIPIVIYHGKKKWNYEPMRSYFDNLDEDLLRYIPEFDFHLINLNTIPDKKITSFKNKFLAISALLFKHSRFTKYVRKIEDSLVELLKLIDNQENNPFSVSIILYIQNTDALTITEIVGIFTRVSKNLNDVVMTTAQQLINQATDSTKIDAIKRGYQNGISIDLLSNILNLPIKKVEEIVYKINVGLL